MKEEDKRIAKVIAKNIHKLLNDLKGDTPQGTCPTCGQCIRTPYTQEGVAEQCGMTKATIVHYFQGTRIPSVLSLKKIAKVFGVDVNTLLEGI